MKILLSACMIFACSLSFGQGKGMDKQMLPQILREAIEKGKTLKFSGTRLVTSVKAGKVETHEEFVTKDGGKLRIEFGQKSPFAGQIIVETGTERLHFFPDRNEIRQSPSSGRKQFDVLRLMRIGRGGKPTFLTSDGGIVAGFKTSRVQVQDSSGNTLGAFHLDSKSGMILKRVLFDQTGSVMASYEFTKVSLNPNIAASAFKFSRRGVSVVRPIDDLKRNAEKLGLPSLGIQGKLGYVLEAVSVRTIKGNPTLIQVYTKNDSRISLFITKSEIGREKPKFGGRDFGAFQWSVSGVNCMLMGNEPENSLKVLSGSVAEIGR